MSNFPQGPEFTNLCHNLTVLRQQHKLSKRVMMAILHVSSRTLNAIESGRIPRGMTPEPIFHAAAYFRMRASDLLRLRL